MRKKVIVGFFTGLIFLIAATVVLGEGAGEATRGATPQLGLALASGLGIAIAAFGGALGQGRAIASALDGIARNPNAAGRIQTPMIIGLALIESLVIYAFVIAFLLQGKI